MSASNGTTVSGTDLQVVDGGHPITNGWSTGTSVTVFDSSQSVNGNVAGDTGGIVANTTGDTGHHSIIAYAAGETMNSGILAPARRVGLFLNDNSATSLTSDGWTLFDQAIDWAAGNL